MIFGFENLSQTKRNVNWNVWTDFQYKCILIFLNLHYFNLVKKVCACDTFLITTVANHDRYLIFPEEEVNKKNICQKGRADLKVTNKHACLHDRVALV